MMSRNLNATFLRFLAFAISASHIRKKTNYKMREKPQEYIKTRIDIHTGTWVAEGSVRNQQVQLVFGYTNWSFGDPNFTSIIFKVVPPVKAKQIRMNIH